MFFKKLDIVTHVEESHRKEDTVIKHILKREHICKADINFLFIINCARI